jgi:hypothetical protein
LISVKVIEINSKKTLVLIQDDLVVRNSFFFMGVENDKE